MWTFPVGKKTDTMFLISEKIGNMLRVRGGEQPTIREIVKETGYSTGTIYAHFGSVRGIIRHLVHLRRSAVAARIGSLINAHDPAIDASVLCDDIVDTIFGSFNAFNLKLVAKVYKIAFDDSERVSGMDRIADYLVQPISNAIERDKTGSFKKLDHQEIVILMRGMMSIIRLPLLDNSPVFATPKHIELTKTYLKNLFCQKV